MDIIDPDDTLPVPNSSLTPILVRMEVEGDLIGATPYSEWEKDPTGTRFKNEVITRPFVPYIAELAGKLKTEGTIGPSRGVSFRGEDGMYYDLIELLRDLSVYVEKRLDDQGGELQDDFQRSDMFHGTMREKLRTDVNATITELTNKLEKQNKWMKWITVGMTINIAIWLITFLVMGF